MKSLQFRALLQSSSVQLHILPKEENYNLSNSVCVCVCLFGGLQLRYAHTHTHSCVGFGRLQSSSGFCLSDEVIYGTATIFSLGGVLGMIGEMGTPLEQKAYQM